MEDDDEFFTSSRSTLGSIFNSERSNLEDQTKDFLSYTAPKQPKKDAPITSSQSLKPSNSTAHGASQLLISSAVHAYKLVDGSYQPVGKLGLALLSSTVLTSQQLQRDYRLLLYLNKQQQYANVQITRQFQLSVSSGNYMSFVDDRTRAAWSVLFDSTPDLVNFMRQVLLARASAVQFADIQVQDLVPPDSSATLVSAGDTVELKLLGHIIVNIASTDMPPALGQVIEDNTAASKFLRVKLGAGSGKVSKALEDAVVGMSKGSRRLVLVPAPKSPYGSVAEPALYDVEVTRVKSSDKQSAPAAPPSGAPSAESAPQSGTPAHPSSGSGAEPQQRARAPSTSTSTSTSIADPAREHEGTLPPAPPEKPDKAKIMSRLARIGQPTLPGLPAASSSSTPHVTHAAQPAAHTTPAHSASDTTDSVSAVQTASQPSLSEPSVSSLTITSATPSSASNASATEKTTRDDPSMTTSTAPSISVPEGMSSESSDRSRASHGGSFVAAMAASSLFNVASTAAYLMPQTQLTHTGGSIASALEALPVPLSSVVPEAAGAVPVTLYHSIHSTPAMQSMAGHIAPLPSSLPSMQHPMLAPFPSGGEHQLHTLLALSENRQHALEVKLQLTRVLEKLDKMDDRLRALPAAGEAANGGAAAVAAMPSLLAAYNLSMQMQLPPHAGGYPSFPGLPFGLAPGAATVALQQQPQPDLDSALAAVRKLVAETEHFKHDADDKAIQIEQLKRLQMQRDSDRLSEVADLRNQLQNRDDSIRNLEQHSEKMSTDYQQQKEQMQTLTSENETLKSSHELQSKALVSLKGEATALQSRLDSEKDALHRSYETQLAELREQLLVANARASSASEEATQQLGARVEALLAEGRELRSQLAEAEAAKTRALDDCRSSEQQVSELKEKVESMMRVSQLEQERDALQSSQELEQNRQLTERVRALEQRIETLLSKNRALVTAHRELEQKYTSLQQEHSNAASAAATAAGDVGVAVQAHVKRIMNQVYQSMKRQLAPTESFDGRLVLQLLLATIKETTLSALSQTAAPTPAAAQQAATPGAQIGPTAEPLPSSNDSGNTTAAASAADATDGRDSTGAQQLDTASATVNGEVAVAVARTAPPDVASDAASASTSAAGSELGVSGSEQPDLIATGGSPDATSSPTPEPASVLAPPAPLPVILVPPLSSSPLFASSASSDLVSSCRGPLSAPDLTGSAVQATSSSSASQTRFEALENAAEAQAQQAPAARFEASPPVDAGAHEQQPPPGFEPEMATNEARQAEGEPLTQEEVPPPVDLVPVPPATNHISGPDLVSNVQLRRPISSGSEQTIETPAENEREPSGNEDEDEEPLRAEMEALVPSGANTAGLDLVTSPHHPAAPSCSSAAAAGTSSSTTCASSALDLVMRVVDVGPLSSNLPESGDAPALDLVTQAAATQAHLDAPNAGGAADEAWTLVNENGSPSVVLSSSPPSSSSDALVPSTSTVAAAARAVTASSANASPDAEAANARRLSSSALETSPPPLDDEEPSRVEVPEVVEPRKRRPLFSDSDEDD